MWAKGYLPIWYYLPISLIKKKKKQYLTLCNNLLPDLVALNHKHFISQFCWASNQEQMIELSYVTQSHGVAIKTKLAFIWGHPRAGHLQPILQLTGVTVGRRPWFPGDCSFHAGLFPCGTFCWCILVVRQLAFPRGSNSRRVKRKPQFIMTQSQQVHATPAFIIRRKSLVWGRGIMLCFLKW